MNEQETKQETYFSSDMKHKLVEKFTVAYYNKSIKLDLAQKTKQQDKDLVQTVTKEKLDELGNKVFSWERQYHSANSFSYSAYSSYSDGYFTYIAVLKDERFAELDDLIDKYSERVETSQEGKLEAEKKLYSLIMLLKKESRIEGKFELEPAKDIETIRLGAEVRQNSQELVTQSQMINKLSSQIELSNKMLKQLLEIAKGGITP
ncbi:MAG TPA: hypothetical protein VFF30_00475 [Nitrososphaerales archaeon]|nr:hypothetical protein [Nitrososphaerales archaeon]